MSAWRQRIAGLGGAAVARELLGREEVRLLTLTGPGGIGKTRLALQTAADAVEDFRDGAFWVPFAPLRDPDLVAATVAQTLGLHEEAGESIEDILSRYLADKQLLLVLDNLEHVVAPARVRSPGPVFRNDPSGGRSR